MQCAQCERAQATVRCIDEKLDYCEACSQLLHGKKARRNHQLETIVAPRMCDECETAKAKLKCLDCGGGKVPLVFCFDCCSSLHSRSARASHSVQKFEFSILPSVEVFIDLGLVPKVGARRCSNVYLDQRKSEPDGVIDLTEDRDGKDEATKKHWPKELKRVKIEDDGLQRESREERPVPSGSGSGKIFRSAIGKLSDSSRSPNLLQCKKEKIEPLRYAEKDLTPPPSEEIKREVSEEAPRRTRRARSVRNYAGMAGLDTSEEERSSHDSPSDSDVEFRGTHKIKRGSVTVEAFVVEATDQDDTSPAHTGEPSEEAVSGIRFKIKKMLDLGLHPDTPEIEAQQALKNAQRLLTKHNIEQAEVLNGDLTDTSSLLGGMRVVELRAKGRAKLGRMESWVLELGWVISDNFDTQFFFKAGSSSKPLRVVFYGISQNADCAGYAFAATFNRITIMSAEYIVQSINEYDEAEKENHEVRSQKKNQGISTRVARSNYRRGIVAGLKEAVEHAHRMRSSKPQPRDEKRKRSKGKDDHAEFSFEDENEYCDLDTPGDDEKSEAATNFEWRCMAITALVQHSKKVGKEFLQSKGIKVRKKTQSYRCRAWNEGAYVQGKKDAETIDINQKALDDVKAKKPRKFRG